MPCSHISNCELFIQFAQNPALILWKTHYCHAGFQRCARFKRSLVGDMVPLTLLPNGTTIEIIRSKEEMGSAALFNAIEKNRTWMVNTFIEKVGIDINSTNVTGFTALMIAAELGNLAMIRILIDLHADFQLRNMDGETALDIAQRCGHHDAVALLNELTNHVPSKRSVA